MKVRDMTPEQLKKHIIGKEWSPEMARSFDWADIYPVIDQSFRIMATVYTTEGTPSIMIYVSDLQCYQGLNDNER